MKKELLISKVKDIYISFDKSKCNFYMWKEVLQITYINIVTSQNLSLTCLHVIYTSKN